MVSLKKVFKISTINTKSFVLTRFGFTFVDIDFALSSSESHLAFAMKIVDLVSANTVVLAGVALTFVNVNSAVVT